MLTLREKHEYEYEIEQLKADIEQLKDDIKRHVSHKSKIKVQYEKLLDKYSFMVTNRSDQARALIVKKWDGEISVTLQDIAHTVFLSYPTVRELSFEYKASLLRDG